MVAGEVVWWRGGSWRGGLVARWLVARWLLHGEMTGYRQSHSCPWLLGPFSSAFSVITCGEVYS